MDYLLMVLVGFGGGAICVYFGLDRRRRAIEQQRQHQEKREAEFEQDRHDLATYKVRLESEVAQKHADVDALRTRTMDALKRKRDEILQEETKRRNESNLFQSNAQEALRKQRQENDHLADVSRQEIAERKLALAMEASKLQERESAFEAQLVKYEELRDENGILKRELRLASVHHNKLRLDGESERVQREAIEKRVQELGSRYLNENVKWIGKSLNANNFASCKDRLLGVIARCREIGFEISTDEEVSLVSDLRTQYEREVRTAFEREEQSRIRAQIREEQKREREIQREMERVERERAVLQAALAKALAEANDEHSSEIESLRARLADAEARERAISQAQLTRAGFVYVISNIGSFGDGVFKIGMTRRLEPLDRVKELGDASVPFPFDIHMMISCDDAPTLESALHRKLCRQQINKTNPRKEFFRTDIDSIANIVREHHGEIQYVADAEALQYRQSLTMSDDDREYIENVFDRVDDDGDVDDDNSVTN